MPEVGRLGRRLRILTICRIAVVTVLLGATALIEWQVRIQTAAVTGTEVAIYRLVAAVCLLSLGYVIALKTVHSLPGLRRLATVQLTGDALFAAGLVFITGGTASVFTFFFSVAILLAAILLYRAGALYVATLSALLLLAIGMMEMGVLSASTWLVEMQLSGVGPLDPVGVESQSIATIGKNLIVNVVAFYAVAFLASYLADQLRRTDAQIQQSQMSLQDLRLLHRNIVNSIQSGLITVNPNREISFFNHVAEQLTAYSASEMVGHDITRYFSDLKQIFSNEDKLQSQTEELTCQVFRGKLSYIRWTISPLRDARGDTIGYVLIFDDVTRVREMEEAVQYAERFASVGRMAAAIAHEIRNPLASISGSIQLLSNSLDLDDDNRRLMNIVGRETDSLNDWISDFLIYARPRLGDRVPVDLHRMVSDALTVLKHDEKSANIDVGFEADSGALVLADPAYIKQVVWNIINNAVQAMPDGGRLDVSIDPLDDERGSFHRICFSDSGRGITDEVKGRLFEPFFTTKATGTGLGLATVFRVVTEHGGFVSVHSEPGLGASFSVDLPRHAS